MSNKVPLSSFRWW